MPSGNGKPIKWSIPATVPRDDPTDTEPPPVVPPALTLCQMAQRTLEKALETWALTSGRTVRGYKVGTRSVDYIDPAQAARAVDSAINMVVKFCGPEYLPDGLKEWSGAARRVIPSDA